LFVDKSEFSRVGPQPTTEGATNNADRFVAVHNDDGVGPGISRRAVYAVAEYSGSANNTKQFIGFNAHAEYLASASGNLTSAVGFLGGRFMARHNGSGTITLAVGVGSRFAFQANSGTGTVTDGHNFLGRAFSSTAGTLTNAYGFKQEEITAGTNNYEFWADGAGGYWCRDADIYVNSDADGFLDLHADNAVRINSGLTYKIASPITTYSAGDEVAIFADASGGGFDVDLPASPTTGDTYCIKKADTGAGIVRVDGNGNNIDGSATQSLSSAYDSIQIVFDGTEWFII
jgi:molybdopterin converting factor small subunit